MDVEITKQNGKTFRLSDYDIIVRDFVVGSIEILPTYSEIEGRHGRVNMGATYGTRAISVPFYFKANDLLDFPLLRDLLFELTVDTEPFYVRELRRGIFQTGDNKYVGGKRYLVRLVNSFDIEQTYKYGFGELSFETTDIPFAESVGTTQDIQKNGINADDELWGFGMGLIAEDEALKYTHTGTSFRIYNAGNVPIHPFQQDLKITIKQVLGSTGYLELRNLTNGTVFRVNEAVSSTQTIVLDGPNITSNGLNFLRKTNKGFIELSPGWNDFQIYGASRATVEFDFRFYYL